MPLAHVSLPVGDHYVAMRDFYQAILKPLGYELSKEFGTVACGFGSPTGALDFWLGGGAKGGLQLYGGTLDTRVAPVHVAFEAKNREHVNEWYDVAIKAGATDNGKPGLRPHYTEGYYAAFVLDPLGNNIEVIFLEQPTSG